MLTSTQTNPFPADQLAFRPYIVKTILSGSQREDHRVAAEKRSHPEGRIIELALVRLRSTAQVPDPPIVLLADGPGVSGIDLLRSEVPVFFLSGTLDARTPISNAEEVARGFSNSHHLIVEGAAHSFVECLGMPTIRETLITFLMGDPVTPSAARIPFQFTPLNEGRDRTFEIR